MNRIRLSLAALVALAAVVVVVIASSGGSTKAGAAVAPGAAVSASQTSLGKTLVDANGRALYLFQGDKPNVSTLSAAGRAVWPPFTSVTTPHALGGTSAAQISTIKGPNGSSQIAYNGHPLYYYVGDHNPGQTAGQALKEFGALWYVLAPSGAAITSAPSSSTPTAPSSSGPSYGGY
jgi:predicted lipoprotein with Yx(FWY)xxD motif